MIDQNYTSAAIGLLAAFIILYLVRKDHLHTRYAIWWIPTAILIAVLGVAPVIVDTLATFLGIHYPPVLILVLGNILLMIKIVLMDVERSKNEVKLQRLTQKLAMLEAESNETKTKLDTLANTPINVEQEPILS
jgi:uncharacterized membrane protein YfcA